jgi:hypothetical protein
MNYKQQECIEDARKIFQGNSDIRRIRYQRKVDCEHDYNRETYNSGSLEHRHNDSQKMFEDNDVYARCSINGNVLEETLWVYRK